MHQNNGNIEDFIQNVFYDIKAEAIIADLAENGLKPEDYVTKQKGIFKRRYTRDIDSIGKLKLENTQNILTFTLNRDGLYDALPEGLFHKKLGNENSSHTKYSENSVELRQEEKAARNFFLPFENEIFNQRVNLELEERKVLSRFSEKIFNDIYPELWSLHRTVNRDYVYRMVLMLHLSYKIVGNIELTARCLQSIIEEKVNAKLVRSSHSSTPTSANNTNSGNSNLGLGTLGVDFVCGENYNTPVVQYVFTIGPLKNTQASDYLKEGAVTKFLNCFYNYFIPIEFDVKTKIVLNTKEQNFHLGGEFAGPVLGYETAI